MILLADSEGLDQTVRTRSLIWAFAVQIYTFSQGAAQLLKKSTVCIDRQTNTSIS